MVVLMDEVNVKKMMFDLIDVKYLPLYLSNI